MKITTAALSVLLLPGLLAAQGTLQLSVNLNQKPLNKKDSQSMSKGGSSGGVTSKVKNRKPGKTLPKLSENHLVIKALDKNGKVLEKRYQYDSSRVRNEYSKSDDQAVVNVDSNLLLQMPNRKDIAKIQIYRPKWNGKKFDLVLIQTVDVPAPSKEQTASKGETVAMKSRSAASVTTLLNNGDSSHKIDVVMIGDGYTADEMDKWHRDADRIAKEFFQDEPFKSYENFFNIHRIDVVSEESGAGMNSAFSVKNAVGSHFNCYNIMRLLCIDNGAANEIISEVLGGDQQDIKFVFVNDKRYGGAGGEFATASEGSGFSVIMHEIGHSFAGLADEYDYDGGGSCERVEPAAPNVTIESNPQKVKWRDIPGTGVFEGAKYCPKGFYRAYEDSIMRSVGGQWKELHIRVLISRFNAIAKGTIKPGPYSQAIVNNQQNIKPTKTTTTATPGKKNRMVLGLLEEDGNWYPAHIKKSKKNKVELAWLDGTGTAWVETSKTAFLDWKDGDTIECKWSGNGEFYPGTVSSLQGEKFQINWEDGDQAEEKSFGDCRQTSVNSELPFGSE